MNDSYDRLSSLNDSLDSMIQKSNNFQILDQLNQKQLKLKKQLELKQQQQKCNNNDNNNKFKQQQQHEFGERNRSLSSDYNSKMQSHYTLLNKTTINLNKPPPPPPARVLPTPASSVIINNDLNKTKNSTNLNQMPKFQLQFHHLQKIDNPSKITLPFKTNVSYSIVIHYIIINYLHMCVFSSSSSSSFKYNHNIFNNFK